MKRLCDLLFELSNEDRLQILKELKVNPMKLSQVSKRLDTTVQEASRNLTRLSDARLIHRDSDSTFNLTPYGDEALRLLTGYEFLSNNSEYLMKHVISGLPPEFTERVGELVGCSFTNDVMTTFHFVENMIENAEEYLLFITDQILTTIMPAETEAVKKGVQVRLLVPSNIHLPPGSAKVFAREEKALEDARVSARSQTRYLDRVDVCLCMSEKEVAGVSFPTLDGRLDHLEFRGLDEASHMWCKDLFEYYWKSARLAV